MEMYLFLAGLASVTEPATIYRLSRIVSALLAMTGRVTMLGISRWTKPGCGYRTVQRFFNTDIPWTKLHWMLIKNHLKSLGGVFILAGDDVVVSKAGHHTHGIGRFFSSIYNTTIPSINYLALSIISVENGTSYPIFTQQLEPSMQAKNNQPEAEENKEKGKRGRPKGSTNKTENAVKFTPFQLVLISAIQTVLALVGCDITIGYFVYDGALGHNVGVQIARQCGLDLISKLRCDSVLYLPYKGT